MELCSCILGCRHNRIAVFTVRRGQMKRAGYMLTSVAIIVLLAGCGGGAARQCCLQYDSGSDDKTYCLNHAVAVGTWVRLDPDAATWSSRLDEFEVFLETIGDCGTMTCIIDGIADAAPTGFKEEFDREHEPAERETALAHESRKVELILCGFRDGAYRTAVELGEER
jgi:hypothetical protein